MNQLSVQSSELSTCASSVQDVIGTVDALQANASQLTAMSPTAFGLLCSFFTPPSVTVGSVCQSSMQQVSAALAHHVAGLKETAKDFEESDARVAERHNSLKGRLA